MFTLRGVRTCGQTVASACVRIAGGERRAFWRQNVAGVSAGRRGEGVEKDEISDSFDGIG